MENVKEILIKYRGAIIGAIIALITILLKIHEIIIGFIIVAAGALTGNYIQRNKEKVKDNIRKVVDRW